MAFKFTLEWHVSNLCVISQDWGWGGGGVGINEDISLFKNNDGK